MQQVRARVRAGAGRRSRDEALQGPVLAVRDSSATTGRGGRVRSACGLDYVRGTVLYTEPEPELHRAGAVDLQETAGSVRALAGYQTSDIAALFLVRVLPALPRQPGGRLATMLAYQMAQAIAAPTKYCRQIGATDSTLSTGSSASQ